MSHRHGLTDAGVTAVCPATGHGAPPLSLLPPCLARGCTSVEQSVLGGCAHLLSFVGSDTMSAAYYAQVGLTGATLLCPGELG